MQFDYKFYINTYDDLKNLSEKQALDHFNKFGKNEGRIAHTNSLLKKYPDFDFQFYLNNYNDLKENGINDKLSSLIHYHNNGIKEGRICSLKNLKSKFPDFDYKFYLSLYKDLQDLSEEQTLFHFMHHGIKENRLKNNMELNQFRITIENLIDMQINQLKNINLNLNNHLNKNLNNHLNNFCILTRTNKREKAFLRNYNSIFEQIYDKDKVFHIVSYHNFETYNYLKNFNVKKIYVKETQIKKDLSNPYPYNLYLNNLVKSINEKKSWIIIIDDDDLFTNKYCFIGLNDEINKIYKKVNHDKFLLFWRVFRCDQLTGQSSYQKSDINLNIALCGFVINSKYKDIIIFDTDKVANTIKNISTGFEIYWSEFIFTKIGQYNKIAGYGAIE
jgi:hypothetical protein